MSAYHYWSEEEVALLRKLLGGWGHYTYQQVADRLNSLFDTSRKAEAVRSKWRTLEEVEDVDQSPEGIPPNAPASFRMDLETPAEVFPKARKNLDIDIPKEAQEFMSEHGLEFGEVKSVPLGNNNTVVYLGPEIKTVEDLRKHANLPEEDWIEISAKPNSWGTAMKLQKREFLKDKGKYDTAGWTVIKVPIYQIKASFMKRTPEAVHWPLVQPVQCTTLPPIDNSNARRARQFKEVHQDLIVSDAQIGFYRYPDGRLEPFHDRRCLDLVLQVAQFTKFDRIWIIGDFLDLADWSDHYVRSPEVYFTTQPMLNEAYWWIYQLKETGAEVIFIEGNHEARLPRVLAKNAVQAMGVYQAMKDVEGEYPVMSIPHWLRLDELGVEYKGNYPNGHDWVNKNLRISHGEVVRSTSMDTVRKMANDNSRYSEVVGHIHRLETAYRSVHPFGGMKMYGFYSVGTLARTQTPMPPSGISRVNWQPGFGTITYQSGNGFAEVDLHPIWGGTLFYEGLVLQANPAVDEIAAEAIKGFK